MAEVVVPALVFICVLAWLAKWLLPQLKSQTDDDVQHSAISIDSFAAATARMEQRIDTIERIMSADNPNWRN